MIEREIPQVGTLEGNNCGKRRPKSNQALRRLGENIQRSESFVAPDATFCVYLAKDEAVIRRHVELSDFPATRTTEIRKMIDTTTAYAGIEESTSSASKNGRRQRS